MIDDAFNLARAGLLDYSVPLKMAKYLRHEDNFVALKAGLTALEHLDKMLRHAEDPAVYEGFKCFIISLLNER